jgi:hypothetical protein
MEKKYNLNYMNTEKIQKDETKKYIFRICNTCGCKQYNNNYARHLKTKKHKEVDYINNKIFDVQKIEPKTKQKNEVIFIK